MISDEPDEDAASLDDETALETFFDEAATKPASKPNDGPNLPDWPTRRSQDTSLPIDAETLAWFKTMHSDWRQQMRSVLRGWVAAHSLQGDSTEPTVPAADADSH